MAQTPEGGVPRTQERLLVAWLTTCVVVPFDLWLTGLFAFQAFEEGGRSSGFPLTRVGCFVLFIIGTFVMLLGPSLGVLRHLSRLGERFHVSRETLQRYLFTEPRVAFRTGCGLGVLTAILTFATTRSIGGAAVWGLLANLVGRESASLCVPSRRFGTMVGGLLGACGWVSLAFLPFPLSGSGRFLIGTFLVAVGMGVGGRLAAAVHGVLHDTVSDG